MNNNLYKTKSKIVLLEGNSIIIDREMISYQNSGFELAGQVTTQFSKNGNMDRMLVPIKKTKYIPFSFSEYCITNAIYIQSKYDSNEHSLMLHKIDCYTNYLSICNAISDFAFDIDAIFEHIYFVQICNNNGVQVDGRVEMIECFEKNYVEIMDHIFNKEYIKKKYPFLIDLNE